MSILDHYCYGPGYGNLLREGAPTLKESISELGKQNIVPMKQDLGEEPHLPNFSQTKPTIERVRKSPRDLKRVQGKWLPFEVIWCELEERSDKPDTVDGSWPVPGTYISKGSI